MYDSAGIYHQPLTDRGQEAACLSSRDCELAYLDSPFKPHNLSFPRIYLPAGPT